jgi:uncharacterized protein YmfQ (DUF2313 family)
MLHKDILKLLFPLELSGHHEADLQLEGAHLDYALDRAGQLLAEVFPDLTDELMSDWERICGLIPGDNDTLQLRRQRLVAKMRETGCLSIPYFIQLAANLGFTITIEELPKNYTGYGDESVFLWRITVQDIETTVYYFRAGESRAGELLSWWGVAELEDIINDLKPAHTDVLFVYD